jgi:hypothetical protein
MTRVLYRQTSGLGVTSSLVQLAGDDHLTVVTEQDCKPLLEQNRREANAYDPALERRSGGYRKIASLPPPVLARLHAVGIMYRNQVLDEKAFRDFLNDPDNRGLRCDNGRRI